jgi:hypothetical protein
MLSATIVLKGESTDRFRGLLAALLEEFQPQTPFEESLIENMAVVRWRRMRIWGMEQAAMEHEMRRQAETPNSTELDPAEHAATRAAIAFRTLSDDSRSLELINRYESRYEVRDRRTPPPLAVPEKVDISKRTQKVIANKAPRSKARSYRRARSRPRTCGYQPRSSPTRHARINDRIKLS